MKKVLIGVSAGAACFKSVQLVSNLVKKGYEVEVIMSKNATSFIAPMSFETFTNRPVIVDTFTRVYDSTIQHISLAKKVDVFAVVPATANVIAKFANGIADDMLTSTFLAFEKTKIVAPAMNTGMYNNVATQRNIKTLIDDKIIICEPEVGYLACGDVGNGRLADLNIIEAMIEHACYDNKVLTGKNVLISAGPTLESIDPVRFISNHSSGKMGYALAKAAYNMGANVTLVSGPTNLEKPYGVKVIDITSANDMKNAILDNFKANDIIIKAAAVADYTPEKTSEHKIKKDKDLSLSLNKTVDILSEITKIKTAQQVICGFAMETQNLLENAQKKFINKKCDLLIANPLVEKGAGFKGDTNKVIMIEKDKVEDLDIMSKEDLSYLILNKLSNILKERKV